MERGHKAGQSSRVLVLTGLLALMAGTLVYLVDRSPESTYLVNRLLGGASLYQTVSPLFGKLGDVLPAFVHPFSFSLITAGLFARTPAKALLICVFWFAVNCAFELGQHFESISLALVPQWFGRVPFLENCDGFFRNGTFDPLDLLAMFAGSALAFCMIAAGMKKEK